MRIDLNCDLGEGSPCDVDLLDVVTSANVACGYHAGDAATMSAICDAARARGVVIGAQVSYPDRKGFGRRAMELPAAELTAHVLYQIGALSAFGRVAYVKPHGALYHRILDDEQQAAALVAAVVRLDPGMPLVTIRWSVAASAAFDAGVQVVAEGFADRAYAGAGRLTDRSSPGAVLIDPQAVAAQAVSLARNDSVRTLCIHSDTSGAVGLARAVRFGLESAGVEVAAFA
ncbi:MAG: LamB/YcsF family protein [Marmoricola sp.]